MPNLRSRRAFLALLGSGMASAVSGCRAKPSLETDQQRWELVEGTTPAEWSRRDCSIAGVTGWDHGFVVANEFGNFDDRKFSVNFSVDGNSWQAAVPEDIDSYAAQPLAAHGSSLYIAGTRAGVPTVWRTHQPGTWSVKPLTNAPSELELTGISAGPRGVLAVGSIPQAKGYHFWRSEDGEGFDAVSTMPSRVDRPMPYLCAGAQGFLLIDTDAFHASPLVLFSPDGWNWAAAHTGLDDLDAEVRPAALGTHAEVLHGGSYIGDPSEGPTGAVGSMFYRDGPGSHWSPADRVEPGRLPDAGVAPTAEIGIVDMAAWRGGFIAIGSHGGVGAVWTAPADGKTWRKAPVRANRFDAVKRLTNLAVCKNKTLLLATDEGARILTWLSL